MPNLHSQQTPQIFNSVSSDPGDDDNALLANTRANARRPHDDGQNAHLAQLIGNREDGSDTFGNVGQTRLGHHVTGDAVPLVGQRTGTGANPFASLQQQQQQRRQQTGGFDQPFFTV